MAEMLSKLKTWWKEILFLFSGAVLLSFFDQLGWVAAAVIGVVLLVVGMLFLVYDLGRKAASQTPKKGVTAPRESKERVLETVVVIDKGEDFELASYYFEKGDRILVEASLRVGHLFSLLIIHESDLHAYERDKEFETLAYKNNTFRHKERLEIPDSGEWYFVIEPAKEGGGVSVDLSVWKLH